MATIYKRTKTQLLESKFTRRTWTFVMSSLSLPHKKKCCRMKPGMIDCLLTHFNNSNSKRFSPSHLFAAVSFVFFNYFFRTTSQVMMSMGMTLTLCHAMTPAMKTCKTEFHQCLHHFTFTLNRFCSWRDEVQTRLSVLQTPETLFYRIQRFFVTF